MRRLAAVRCLDLVSNLVRKGCWSTPFLKPSILTSKRYLPLKLRASVELRSRPFLLLFLSTGCLAVSHAGVRGNLRVPAFFQRFTT